jgi:hypothetical protein
MKGRWGMPMRLRSMFVDWLRGVSAAPPAPRQRERRPDGEPPRESNLLRAPERDAIVASHLKVRLQGRDRVGVGRCLGGNTSANSCPA